MKIPRVRVYPLVLVLSAICIVEATITVLYGRLEATWEKVPVLIVILAIPIAVVGCFIYLWLRRPGFLYPPSELGDDNLEAKFSAYKCRSTRLHAFLMDFLEERSKGRICPIFDKMVREILASQESQAELQDQPDK